MRPTGNEVDIVRNSNDIPLLGHQGEHGEEQPSNVLMAHASDDSIFNKTEVLAGQSDPQSSDGVKVRFKMCRNFLVLTFLLSFKYL